MIKSNGNIPYWHTRRVKQRGVSFENIQLWRPVQPMRKTGERSAPAEPDHAETACRPNAGGRRTDQSKGRQPDRIRRKSGSGLRTADPFEGAGRTVGMVDGQRVSGEKNAAFSFLFLIKVLTYCKQYDIIRPSREERRERRWERKRRG